MSQAMSIFYQLFARGLQFMFDDLTIVSGVSYGWICVSVLIFGLLVNSLLSIPRAIQGSEINYHRQKTRFVNSMKKR